MSKDIFNQVRLYRNSVIWLIKKRIKEIKKQTKKDDVITQKIIQKTSIRELENLLKVLK